MSGCASLALLKGISFLQNSRKVVFLLWSLKEAKKELLVKKIISEIMALKSIGDTEIKTKRKRYAYISASRPCSSQRKLFFSFLFCHTFLLCLSSLIIDFIPKKISDDTDYFPPRCGVFPGFI